MKGEMYRTCVRSAMLYGSETWAMRVEDQRRMERAEMRMLRWMCGVSLAEGRTNEDVRRLVGVEPIEEVMRRGRLRWYGHVERMGDEDWVKRCRDMEVAGKRARGRPRKTWMETVKGDMTVKGLKKEDAQDRVKWRAALRL